VPNAEGPWEEVEAELPHRIGRLGGENGNCSYGHPLLSAGWQGEWGISMGWMDDMWSLARGLGNRQGGTRETNSSSPVVETVWRAECNAVCAWDSKSLHVVYKKTEDTGG